VILLELFCNILSAGVVQTSIQCTTFLLRHKDSLFFRVLAGWIKQWTKRILSGDLFLNLKPIGFTDQ
jgi:hypothetical protein